MPRGGKREGSGRKRQSPAGRQQLQISLTEDEIALIKDNAKKAELPVSHFILHCVRQFLEN